MGGLVLDWFAQAGNVLFSGTYNVYGSATTNAANGELVVIEWVVSNVSLTPTWVATSIKLGSP
jgi:hypothetical protein